jgi:hypothetical protein
MEFSGVFETHLTLQEHHTGEMEDLRLFAEPRGLKYLHILLDRGMSVSQPMLTRHGEGTLSGELSIAHDLSRELGSLGWTVTRIKIEAAPFNHEVPRTDLEACRLSPSQYFEHHIKLLIESRADVDGLAALAGRHQAHLSRNALRVRDDGWQERFVTQRCWAVGRVTAEKRLQALTDELAKDEWMIAGVEAEFVVYDSNLEIDAGWITNEERRDGR